MIGYDPVAGEEAREALALSGTELRVAGGAYDALRGVHAAVLVTEWEEMRSLDYARVAAHVDAAQAVGRLPFDFAATGADVVVP